MGPTVQDNCNEEIRLIPSSASYTTCCVAALDSQRSRWDVEIDVKGQVDTGSVQENGKFSISKLLQYTGPGTFFHSLDRSL